MPERILVTGGTGTLGRLIVPRLRSAGCEVRAASRRSADLPVDVATGAGLAGAVAGCEDEWEVGWELDPAFWGRGLATEGGRVGVRLGFEAAGLERIISATLAQNRASRRVMEKCGLNYKGTMPYHGKELVWYAIDRLDWGRRQDLPEAARPG